MFAFLSPYNTKGLTERQMFLLPWETEENKVIDSTDGKAYLQEIEESKKRWALHDAKRKKLDT